MGIRSRIPGTQARRDRLFQEILTKEVGDKDGLALVEWEDGSITLKPVIWESDLSAIIDPETNDFWLARGRGAEPKDFNGIPVWRVYAGNAGVISTEAALIGDRERFDDVVDVGAGDEVPDELFELGLEDPNGNRTHAEVEGSIPEGPSPNGATPEAGAAQTATDGGAPASMAPSEGAIYDLRAPDGFDGQAIDVRDADDFDPYPVSRDDAKSAAEWFEQSAEDATDTWMKGFLVGILVTVGLAAIFLGGPWLASQIAGSGAGTSAGENIPGLLPVVGLGWSQLTDRVKEVRG